MNMKIARCGCGRPEIIDYITTWAQEHFIKPFFSLFRNGCILFGFMSNTVTQLLLDKYHMLRNKSGSVSI